MTTCVTAACNIYDNLYKLKPGSSKTRLNLIGNAWDLANIANGDTRTYDAKVNIGDLITFSRPTLPSDQKKHIPSENQHVGVVVRVENGIPIVRHFTNSYKEEPINNVTFHGNIKYQPSKITSFNIPDNIAQKVTLPILDNMTDAEKYAIQKINNSDFKHLMLDQNALNDLVYTALAIMGTETKWGGSPRFVFRSIAPELSAKLQQFNRYIKYNGDDKTFSDFKVEPSTGYASIKPSTTFRNIGYYDTDSLPENKRRQINNSRFRSNDVTNLYSSRSNTAKTLALLNADEKEIGLPETDVLAVISKLSNLYRNNSIPTDNDVLSYFKGRVKDKKEYLTYKNNYINQTSDFKNTWSNISDVMTNVKRWYNGIQKDLALALEENMPFPLQFEAFYADQKGVKSPMTEKSLSKGQLSALEERARKALKETNGLIGYSEANDKTTYTPWITDRSRQLSSVGASPAKGKAIFNAFFDIPTQLAQTLGQVKVTEDDNNIYVTDSYDFNNQGSILNYKHLLMKTKGDPYGIFRGMGTMRGSNPEYGRPVKITMPKKKYIVNVEEPTVETLWLDSNKYDIKNGRVKDENRFTPQYKIIVDTSK